MASSPRRWPKSILSLAIRDKNGQIDSVRYNAINAMLLNEFLKEHRKNEEQEKTIAELNSGMTALAATVKEQAAQIQKVSAQLEASKPAPQVVNNPLKPVGIGAASERLIPIGERSGLQTRIATTESVSLCVRMKS